MYKVFPVEGGWEVFWCPSAPYYYSDKSPYDGKVYTTRSAAYRRMSKLTQALARQRERAMQVKA
jgi:hypothetical protein